MRILTRLNQCVQPVRLDGLAVVLSVGVLAACAAAPIAAPSDPPSATPSDPPSDGARQALIVDLPGTATWRAVRMEAGAGGLVQRRWRAPAGSTTAGTATAGTATAGGAPAGAAGWCVVTLAEQPAAGFPVGVMAGFDDQPGGGTVTLNRQIPAPAGTAGAVDQARTFTLHSAGRTGTAGTAGSAGGTDEVGVLRARHLLTRSGAVVSVVAAAPQRAVDSCRPESIVSSARLGMRTVVAEPGVPGATGQPIAPGEPTEPDQGVLVLTGLGG